MWRKTPCKCAGMVSAKSGVQAFRMPSGITALTLSTKNGSPPLEEFEAYNALKKKPRAGPLA